MYSEEDINTLKELIIDTISPEKIILFGSYAYGAPTESSDIDLLVIMPDLELSFDEVAELGYQVIAKHFKKQKYLKNDLCIVSKNDYKEMKNVIISAVYDAARKGKVLYDKNNMES